MKDDCRCGTSQVTMRATTRQQKYRCWLLVMASQRQRGKSNTCITRCSGSWVHTQRTRQNMKQESLRPAPALVGDKLLQWGLKKQANPVTVWILMKIYGSSRAGLPSQFWCRNSLLRPSNQNVGAVFDTFFIWYTNLCIIFSLTWVSTWPGRASCLLENHRAVNLSTPGGEGKSLSIGPTVSLRQQ